MAANQDAWLRGCPSATPKQVWHCVFLWPAPSPGEGVLGKTANLELISHCFHEARLHRCDGASRSLASIEHLCLFSKYKGTIVSLLATQQNQALFTESTWIPVCVT